MGLTAGSGIVAVVGGANMDITGLPSIKPTLRDSTPGRVVYSPGGVGRNVCENLARMGVHTRLFTAVGCDANGQQLLQSCAGLGVDVSPVLHCEDATSVYLSINDESGDMLCALSAMDIVGRITPEYLAACKAQLEDCQAIFCDANLQEETIAYLAREFGHIPIFADCVSTAKAPRLAPALGHIHTLKPNRKEAALLAGMPVENKQDAWVAARRLREAGVANVAISLGDEGLLLCGSLGEGELQPPPVCIASANGAGDALMAGLIYSHVCGLSLQQTLRVGCAAARLALSSPTTVNPNITENILIKEAALL